MQSDASLQTGKRLKELRVATGLSQADVGERVGLPRSAVTQIEAGRRDVTAIELGNFASICRRSPSPLLSDPPIDNCAAVDKCPLTSDLLRLLGESEPIGDLRVELFGLGDTGCEMNSN
jgi:transcriptional regulator with XRE-family HTH domain